MSATALTRRGLADALIPKVDEQVGRIFCGFFAPVDRQFTGR
jgi:hypothetical protein